MPARKHSDREVWKMKARWALVLVVVLVLGAMGVVHHATTSAALASPASVVLAPKADADLSAEVYMSVMAFRPKELHIALGTEVTWTNRDHVNHTVTGADFDSGNLGYHRTFSHTFYEPGRYPYHDRNYHLMTGVIVVGE
jgi:plastocyanin